MDIIESILKERYYQEGEDWGKMCHRVAHAIAQGEAGKGMEESFFYCLNNKLFLPNSPTLMNGGLPNGTLSACFVVEVKDSMESILDTVKEMAIIGKSGGGVGANWSNIRPAGSLVGSTNGVASGPVSFLELVNTMGDVVKQGGRRRMAVISILNADHPDIEEFISVKTDPTKLNNMNLSVMVNDEFMEKVYQGDTKEKETWDLLVKTAYETGEPGLLFYDRINRDNITNIPIESTNPCGEQPLIPYGSCNLISIDVSKLVENGKFNWEMFNDLIDIAVKFSDATIDVNDYPLEKIKDVATNYRNIGLGIMGFSHLLIKLGIRYGSEGSFNFAKKLSTRLYDRADFHSRKLGNQIGCFPMCGTSKLKFPRRNAYLTSIQPNGTVSTLANCSFSIEPLFSVAYNRKVLDETFPVVDPLFKEMILEAELNIDEITKLVIGKNSIQDIEEIPEYIRELFVTAHDITPEEHVEMVAIFQENIDAGISKTVNLPANATIKDVDNILKLAYEYGCKGITVFRDGSRSSPITIGSVEQKVIDTDYIADDVTIGVTSRLTTGCGHIHVNASGKDGRLLKVFNNPTTNNCEASLNAIGRLCSLCLRSGIKSDLVTKQLDKVKCNSCLTSPKATCKSCAEGVSQTIKLYEAINRKFDGINYTPVKTIKAKSNLIKCFNCGKEYEQNMKCSVCPHCLTSNCL